MSVSFRLLISCSFKCHITVILTSVYYSSLTSALLPVFIHLTQEEKKIYVALFSSWVSAQQQKPSLIWQINLNKPFRIRLQPGKHENHYAESTE